MVNSVLRRFAKRPCSSIGACDGCVAVHAHEPLRGREEDDGVMTAPAVRVRMFERFAVPETAARRQRLFDLGVGVEYPLPAEETDSLEEVSTGIDRSVDVETVFPAGQKIVRAVPGGRVHRTSTLLERHVVG